MRAAVAILANQAAVENGLIYVNGGGWEYVNALQLPCQASGCIAGVFELEIAELGLRPVVRFDIHDSAGQLAGFQGSMIVDAMRDEVPEIGFARVPFAVPFTVVLPKAEVYTARIVAEEGEVLAAIPFSVMLPPERV